MPTFQSEEMLQAMKRAAGVLQNAGVKFALAGGLAAWARGGPPTEHDIDFLIKHEDAEPALGALAEAGMRTERPPEGWLVKAYDGDVLIDLIFEPSGLVVDDDLLARADVVPVHAVPMPVLSVDDVIVSKLRCLCDTNVDYAPVLQIARALREQVDWDTVRARVADSPFAAAFFTLVERLGIAPPSRPA
jgi:Nucleotidyl transferase of unknown function (DUF2204)